MTTVTSHTHVQPVVCSSARAKRLRHNCSQPCELKSQLPKQQRRTQAQRLQAIAQAPAEIALDIPVKSEADVEGMSAWLNSLKWDAGGLVTVIAQHIDTGEVLMQAFADRAALSETLQTGLATFYSRSRKGRWCKGETSGHYIKVVDVYLDCDRDSIIYQSEPIGPACHTGARSCYFASVQSGEHGVQQIGNSESQENMPASSLFALENIIQQRVDQSQAAGSKPSWTAKLANNQELLCSKIREEAGELCQTLEQQEGQERAASEMADLLYHSMVLLNVQDVPMGRVLAELRRRFGTSGLVEKASRPVKKDT